MPQIVRFGNNLHDRICSKCKRMREPQDYEHRNVVYRTCNHCRFKAYRRTRPLNTYSDFMYGGIRVINVGHYTDTDSNYSEQAIMQEYAAMSSSSAAASAESYFVKEPEPEPEPDSKPEY